MIWFLGTISERLKAVVIPEECPSQVKIRPGEYLVGVMPDDIKRLYIFMHEAYEKKCRVESEDSVNTWTATADGPNSFERKQRVEIIYQTLVSCFLISVQESMLGLSGRPFAVREHWQIVTTSPVIDNDQLSSRWYGNHKKSEKVT
jgi:hypothetical protein